MHLDQTSVRGQPMVCNDIPMVDKDGNAILFEEGSPILIGCELGVQSAQTTYDGQEIDAHTHLEFNRPFDSGYSFSAPTKYDGDMRSLYPYDYLDMCGFHPSDRVINKDRERWKLEVDKKEGEKYVYN